MLMLQTNVLTDLMWCVITFGLLKTVLYIFTVLQSRAIFFLGVAF